MPVVKRIDAEITLKLGVMTFRPSHENNTIFPKTKKARRARKNKLCGLFSLSGAGFRLSPKELLCCHVPMNSNIVTVVFPDLDPVNQLGDHQMLGFVAGMTLYFMLLSRAI